MSAVVHSFAVFDTCLIRAYVRPTDLFFLLAARVLPDRSVREDMHEFVRLRLEAQRTVQSQLKVETAGLGLVYERFPRDNPWGLDPEQLLSSEQDLIVTQVAPAPEILARVRGLVRRGERVVYVSGSQIPAAALRRLLETHGFAGEVYCSGDTGKAKETGSLYRHVLAAENVLPEDMEHTGADLRADVRAPRELGVRVAPFAEARLTRHESRLLRLHEDCRPSLSRTVGACRLARLRAPETPGFSGLRALAADVAAPALTAFVAWALEDAGGLGARRLYFLAREGQVLHRLARILSPVVGGPEPRYLHISLGALNATGLEGLTRRDFDWLARAEKGKPVGELLTRLRLTPEEVSQAAGKSLPALYSAKPPFRESLDELWRILESPPGRELLSRKSREAGTALLDYLKSQGALDEPVLAVADMGWTLTTQQALRAVLAPQGADVRGWYFGLTNKRLGRSEAGPHRALFIERAAQAVPGSLDSLLFRNVLFLERIFTRADHGRVLGYARRSGAPVPLFGPAPMGQEHTQELQETVLAFARSLVRFGWSQEVALALRETAVQSLRRFLSLPEPYMARAVAELPGESGLGSLCRPLTLSDALRAWLRGRLGLGFSSKSPPAWLEGSLAVSSGPVRRLFQGRKGAKLLRAYFGL
ncbi:hypothetical protein JCM15519_27830 [Fundidesulfovibrio butyratiphilus]